MKKNKRILATAVILGVLIVMPSAFAFVMSGGRERLLFTGKELEDGTSLYYYGARYYDAFLRRFTQPDSIIANPYDPQNLNRYSYVLNNPLKYKDSTGNFADCVVGCPLTISASIGVWVAVGATASLVLSLVAYDTLQTPGATDAYYEPLNKNLYGNGPGIYDLPYSPYLPLSEPGLEEGPGYEFPPLDKSGLPTYLDRIKNPNRYENPIWKDIKENGEVYKQDPRYIKWGNNYYRWDKIHNDIEVFNKQGKHLGSKDPTTGKMYKPPVKGRDIYD